MEYPYITFFISTWFERFCIDFVDVVCFRFRRQHEQLRQVIMRVLRPATTTVRPGSPSHEEVEGKAEPMALDAADANAIEVRTEFPYLKL